jgi:hypothetical protein
VKRPASDFHFTGGLAAGASANDTVFEGAGCVLVVIPAGTKANALNFLRRWT